MGGMIDLDWKIVRRLDQIESVMNAEVFDGEIGVAKSKGPIREVLGSIRLPHGVR